MKKQWVLIAISLLGLAACNPPKSSDDIKKDIDRSLEDMERKNKATLDDADKFIKAIGDNKVDQLIGGQPGVIKLSGVIVKEDEGKTSLDPRITYSQEVGKSVYTDSQPIQVSVKEKAVLDAHPKTEEGLKKAKDLKTYLAVGCQEVDSNLVPGLQKVELPAGDKALQLIEANTVILCDAAAIESAIVLVEADHIILNKVNFTLGSRASFASLSLTANRLTLIGENKIMASGEDLKGVKAPILTGASLAIQVQEELAGEGSLALKTIGGNRTRSEEPEKSETDKK